MTETHEHAEDPARAALLALREEVGKAVVGQDSVVTGLVIALLFGAAPPDDPALVRLVNDLDTLERTVRRT